MAAARTRRRRRLAVAALCALAAGALAFGASLQEGSAPPPSLVSRLSAGQLAGQRIVLGFPGATLPREVVRMIGSGEVAGVVLFEGNFLDRAAARRLIRRLQAIPRPPGLRDPLLVMTDQEGGLVERIAGPPGFSAREMGVRGPAFSHAQGRRTAAALRGLGVNVDLAPVLDVGREGGAIETTDRAFGGDAASVAASAIPFAVGLREGGVAATAKHFPGFGAAHLSTDDAAVRIDLPAAELRAVDEAPFRRFASRGGELTMLSTAIYPDLSPLPAALSRAVATGELRERLGFDGVSITDALATPAVRAFGDTGEVAIAAARAGADLLLCTRVAQAAPAWRALREGLRRGSLSRARFEQSASRVLRLRRQLDS